MFLLHLNSVLSSKPLSEEWRVPFTGSDRMLRVFYPTFMVHVASSQNNNVFV
jgi:hypothetical protein